MTGQGNVLTTVMHQFFAIEMAGLAIDSNGNLYVGDTDRHHQVIKIAPMVQPAR